jgi:hypothetical protein
MLPVGREEIDDDEPIDSPAAHEVDESPRFATLVFRRFDQQLESVAMAPLVDGRDQLPQK